jgi:FtsP/CotA-like multicopper oxidase with cupredoxin domain
MMKRLAKRFSSARKNKSRRRQQHVPTLETLEDRVLLAVLPLGPMQGGTPNYFGPEPNWAYSALPTVDPVTGDVTGGIRKFMDALPGLYVTAPTQPERDANLAAADNALGQYIPVAISDTTTYPGSDYYEIELGEYTEQMHSDLNPTTLRGYRQVNTTDPYVSQFHCLGPMIVAREGRPVRIKFINSLPVGAGGDLFVPVDTTVMGAGMGPHMIMPMHTHYMDGSPTVSIHAMEPHNLSVGSLVQLEGFLPEAYNGEFRVVEVVSDMSFKVTLASDPGEEAATIGHVMELYTDNRGTLHLHGGLTPWISDGTMHQWITPAGEFTNYDKGASTVNVPDMPDPGDGAMTFFWPNQQSARLMFYHDHAFGITRLNVYAGEAAGYLLTDDVEQDLMDRGIIPSAQIPLIIQDKTFIDPATLLASDPTWPLAIDDALSNLWMPHVYMPNNNPNALDGVNPLGRWDYGPWIWPPFPVEHEPIQVPDGSLGFGFDGLPDVLPNLPDVSMGMESFMDTAVVNGTAYPYLDVDPQAYRFRILNAANDRFWNLQLYEATSIISGVTITDPGSLYLTAPSVRITDPTGIGAIATTTISPLIRDPLTNAIIGGGQVTAVTMQIVGSGYTSPTVEFVGGTLAPGGTAAAGTASVYGLLPGEDAEVGMVPFCAYQLDGTAWPDGFPTADLRDGGIPDPNNAGPSIIQIGTEGGFLPAPVTFNNIPIGWDRDPKSATVGNVLEHNLFLGCAERADVIIDFSQFAGKTLILYSDAPAAVPARDARYDYYTANQDETETGGSVPTLPGYGPNTRTLMQIRVRNTTPADPFDTVALENEFRTRIDPDTGAVIPGVFARGQDPIIVPQDGYNSAYGLSGVGADSFSGGTDAYERIHSTALTFRPLDLSTPELADLVADAVTITNDNKAIVEEWATDWGRMDSFLGVEVPFTNSLNQTSLWFRIQDPVTEIVNNTSDPFLTPIGSLADGTQLWKITHNGVDTHAIHFHLFNVQVVNRVDWVGVVKPPEANELGWKETVRMNPLEDIIVALRPTAPDQPFGVPDSVRLLDPTMPQGSTMGFVPFDANGDPVTTVNEVYNFGWEYMWHCHLLSHEEMDMMRPIQVNVARELPAAPVLDAVVNGADVALTWTDGTPVTTDPATWGNPANEVGYRIERALIESSGQPGVYLPLGLALANATSFTDATYDPLIGYAYRVVAFNAAGETLSNVVLLAIPAAPTSLVAAVQAGPQVSLTWTDNAANETGFVVQRSDNGGVFATIATPAANPGTGNVTYVDSTAQFGNTYAYQVCAVNGPVIASAYSNTATVILLAAPTGLTATLQAGPQVSLTWTDNATNETGFVVQRSDNGGAFTTIATPAALAGTGTVTYVDATAQPGNTYVYQVSAVNGAFASAFSNTASLTMPVAPAAPTGLTAKLKAKAGTAPQIVLTFRDNATNETGFLLERAVNGGVFASLATLPAKNRLGNVSYTDTVTAGNTYAYRVRAVNGVVPSAYSNTVTLAVVNAPAAPSNFTGIAMATGKTSARINLSWTDNSTNETQFVIQRASAIDANGNLVNPTTFTVTRNASQSNAVGGTVTLTQKRLQRATTYYYQILARNAFGDSVWVNLNIFPITVP